MDSCNIEIAVQVLLIIVILFIKMFLLITHLYFLSILSRRIIHFVELIYDTDDDDDD